LAPSRSCPKAGPQRHRGFRFLRGSHGQLSRRASDVRVGRMVRDRRVAIGPGRALATIFGAHDGVGTRLGNRPDLAGRSRRGGRIPDSRRTNASIAPRAQTGRRFAPACSAPCALGLSRRKGGLGQALGRKYCSLRFIPGWPEKPLLRPAPPRKGLQARKICWARTPPPRRPTLPEKAGKNVTLWIIPITVAARRLCPHIRYGTGWQQKIRGLLRVGIWGGRELVRLTSRWRPFRAGHAAFLVWGNGAAPIPSIFSLFPPAS